LEKAGILRGTQFFTVFFAAHLEALPHQEAMAAIASVT
jgi:hypothetical protein